MNIKHLCATAAAIVFAGWSAHALAAQVYPTEGTALEYCGTDPVVFIDLDHGKFYMPNQPEYAGNKNGGFACYTQAARNYRPGQSAAVTTTVTRQTTVVPGSTVVTGSLPPGTVIVPPGTYVAPGSVVTQGTVVSPGYAPAPTTTTTTTTVRRY